MEVAHGDDLPDMDKELLQLHAATAAGKNCIFTSSASCALVTARPEPASFGRASLWDAHLASAAVGSWEPSGGSASEALQVRRT